MPVSGFGHGTCGCQVGDTDQAPFDILQHHQLCITVGDVLTCYASACYIVHSSCHRVHLCEQINRSASSGLDCHSGDDKK